MRWRDILVGAVVTLTVSILSGIVVWLFTRDSPPAERLRYSVEELASFRPGEVRIGIVTIKASNTGTKAARDVRFVVVFPAGIEIREKQITSSSGPTSAYSEVPSDTKTLDLQIRTLAPDETITASFLLAGSGSFTPQVGLKSSETVGTVGETKREAASTNRFEIWKVGTALLFQGLALFILFLLRGKLKGTIGAYTSSPNNTAFLLLQQGLASQASAMLSAKVKAKGGDAFELANLALALALEGNDQISQKMFQAAEWLAGTKHSKAVLFYNRATLLASLTKYDESKAALREALLLSPKEIKKYFSFSAYFADASKADSEFCTIVEGKIVPKDLQQPR